MKKYTCPCGCGREPRNDAFWYSEECGDKGRKKGVYMPRGGEWRSHERLIKKIKKVKHVR